MYRTVRTVNGIGAPFSMATPTGTFTSTAAARASRALTLATTQNPGAAALVQQARADAVGGGPGPVEVPQEVRDRCLCLVENAAAPAFAAQGMTLTATMMQVLFANCTSDTEAFVETLDQRGIDHDGCKPWYQRRVTKYAAGGALALGLLYLVVRR
jgi:hypothetical protein